MSPAPLAARHLQRPHATTNLLSVAFPLIAKVS